MNRNTESHFGNVPKIHQARSKFDMSHSHKTTLSEASIVPIFLEMDVTPGDTIQLDMAEVVRMATPIYPVMDNAYLDVNFFFVPNRLLYDHWVNFWGETDDPFMTETEYNIPQITAPTGGWKGGTLADYMGIPTLVDGFSVNALPFRAYVKIWNDWYRDTNLKNAVHMYKDETTRTGTNTGDPVTNAELGGVLLKAARFADRFSKASPSPQRGPDVKIPLGATAPVRTGSSNLQANQYNHLYWANANDYTDIMKNKMIGTYSDGSTVDAGSPTGINQYYVPANLEADLSNATAATISALRSAFAVQKYYEASALYGNRYIEVIRGIFGVESSDARLQRSEFISGIRVPINMSAIVQTSATDSVTPQGNVSGMSCTVDKNSMFTKSFEEHGILMGLACIRVDHAYQQGLEPGWTRKKKFDYYNPFFAHLSQQPVYKREIMLTGGATDEEVWGYQEAWSDYRFRHSRVSSAFRSNYEGGSLDSWHYADDYETVPYLGSEWIDEPTENIDRTIAVTSNLADQFIADFYFKTYYTRCMPVYSVPGLIDHV